MAALSARAFAWDRATLATLEHSSLPWGEELAVTPLSEARNLGARDRLSLVAQLAAHEAFLQFAGIADADLDAAEWAVVQKRGSDVRLVRVAARASDPTTAPPVLTIVHDLADLLGAELDVLRQSWARADAIYAAAFARLARDAAADLRWVRSAACGAIDAPGDAALHAIANESGVFAYDDDRCPAAILRFAQLGGSLTAIVFRGASPLERYSALGAYAAAASQTPGAVADRILAATSAAPHVFIVENDGAIDAASREVIGILASARHGTWVMPRDGLPLPATRWFLIAPRLQVRDTMRGPFASFVHSPPFAAYLAHGETPQQPSTLPPLAEPARSYLGALALLGTRIPRATAQHYLEQFLFHGTLDELACDGVCRVDDEAFAFASDAVREEAMRLVPAASRASICRVAATHCDGVAAALLWLDADEPARAIETLERTELATPRACIEAFQRIPASILTPALARRHAHALIDCGRYRDACDAAPEDELVLARAERRMGDYATALARLERLDADFDASLL
ncbi:MAG TPA: hypothetical protein VFO89_10400, partial [Thermoanaerobaculia bacterium]|nr:hypothetical protein [Thermoanaerobaculia bacterium]